MVKISDIAKTTGVSVSSVSRILRKDESFSATQSTIDKVVKTAEEMGYKPLRVRKEKNVKNICLLMMMTKQDEELDPYWSKIRSTIEIEAKRFGFKITNEYRIDSTESLNIDKYKGCIVLGSISPDRLNSMGLMPQNTVVIDNSTLESQGFDKVVSDLHEATVRIVNDLFDKGHRRIAFIGGQDEIIDDTNQELIALKDQRHKAYEDQMRIKNLYNEKLVFIGGWSSKNGYEFAKEIVLMKEKPTSIIVASDPIAIGVLHALHEENVRVPEDVSVVSFDNIEASEFLNPPLSSIDLHDVELGRQAVLLLIQRLEGRLTPIKVVVQSKLIERDSVKVLNGGDLINSEK